MRIRSAVGCSHSLRSTPGPGARSPKKWTRVRNPANASLPVTFCSTIDGTSASNSRSLRPSRQCGRRRWMSTSTGCRGSKPVGSSSAPSSEGTWSSAQSAPSPHASACTSPSRGRDWITRVAGPVRRTDAAPVAGRLAVALDAAWSGHRRRAAAGAGCRRRGTASRVVQTRVRPDSPTRRTVRDAVPTTLAGVDNREGPRAGHRARLPAADVVRRLPAAGPPARRPAAAERPAAARRAAVHRPAPDLRALAQAARPRAALGALAAGLRRPLPRPQAAGPGQARAARAHRPVVGAGDDDAVGVRPDPAVPGHVLGLPVGAVPRGRVPARQQERRHGQGLRPRPGRAGGAAAAA